VARNLDRSEKQWGPPWGTLMMIGRRAKETIDGAKSHAADHLRADLANLICSALRRCELCGG